MDPALWEVVRSDQDESAEIEAILRLDRPDVDISGLRIVSQFGPIATCRLQKRSILRARNNESVRSLKAARSLGPEPEVSFPEAWPQEPVKTDVRRPRGLPLDGAGCCVCIIDWGCDITHPDFIGPNGTRILALWDQRDQGSQRPPNKYGYGIFHFKEQIDRALKSRDPFDALGYDLDDPKGIGTHGTHVLGIAAGNGNGGGPVGIAPKADLLFVHLADTATDGLTDLGSSSRIIEALDFITQVAGLRPWVANLSVGRHGGPHDGRTLCEMAFDCALRAAPNRFIVQSAGNYAGNNIHTAGRLSPGQTQMLTLITDEADQTANEIEIWYAGKDVFRVMVQSPSGDVSPWVALGQDAEVSRNGAVVGRVYHRSSDPNNSDNHVDIFLYPNASPGPWTIILRGEKVNSDGIFHAWIERDDACPHCQAHFRQLEVDGSCTIGTLANGHLPLVVGAHNPHVPGRIIAPFSSRGPTRDGRYKPDLVAPGVGILSTRSAQRNGINRGDFDDLYVRKSGTSMAAPHVTGAVALCLAASPRPLWASDIRRLVLENLDAVEDNTAKRLRYGQGYLNLQKLVHGVLAVPAVRPAPAVPVGFSRREIKNIQREFPMRFDSEQQYDSDEVSAAEPAEQQAIGDASAARLSTELRIPLEILDPDELYSQLVVRKSGPLVRLINKGYSVVALPGETPRVPVGAGDVLIRVALGQLGFGYKATIAEPRVWYVSRGSLPSRPTESQLPGFYATVSESPSSIKPASGPARRVLDCCGKVPHGQLLLRPLYRQTGPHERESLEVTEEYPRGDEARIAEPFDVTDQTMPFSDERPISEEIEETDKPVLQAITHAGPYRLAYDRLTRLGVIEPAPARDKRKFDGTAALQRALDEWASYIPRIMRAPAYILTAGTIGDGKAMHGAGLAIDIDGFWWSETEEYLAISAAYSWTRYLEIEASLRKVFGTVLNYDYNTAHHNHWHCDLGTPTKWRSALSQAKFAQRALNEIWGESLQVDGKWGKDSTAAAAKWGYRFELDSDWDRFLDDIIGRRTSVATGTQQAPTANAGTGAHTAPQPSADLTSSRLGTLVLRRNGQTVFQYRFTPDDLLWTARLISGEAGAADDMENRAVIAAMFNRYALFTNRVYHTFSGFLRAYSTPLQAVLLNKNVAQHYMNDRRFVATGGTYPDSAIPRGQLQQHIDLQNTPWEKLRPLARTLAQEALSGQMRDTGIGNASEFASTWMLYGRRVGSQNRTDAGWLDFTEKFKQNKGWRWIGARPNLNQKRNAFFIDPRAVDLPPGSVSVLEPA